MPVLAATGRMLMSVIDGAIGFGAYAEFGITPSCSQRRHDVSNSGFGSVRLKPDPVLLDQCSRTMSYADRSGRSVIAAITSCADLPLYKGAINGCTIDAVPSYARASLQDSRKCASGICH